MLRLSTVAATSLILLFILGSISYAENQPWPLRGRIDLSSGFGDYRLNRFHAGVDLRTGGRIGKPVFSPVNGSVWRVKMSYDGYGKGLYIKGDDEYIYVFGHLSALSDKIDRTVKQAQNRAQRYYVDLSLPEDSIPVKKGERIALSGQTGVGAPHLHFEKRSPNNLPLNPLTHGFRLRDKVPPIIERLGFELTDDHSLFPDGSRAFFVDAKRTQIGWYELDTVLYLSSPFGFLVDGYDQMRGGGMRQAPRRIAVTVDGRLLYESVFDTLDFALGPSVQLEYDHPSAAAGEKRIRRLYDRPGNRYFGSRGVYESNGIIGLDSAMSEGVHEVLIEVQDAFGNESLLEFKFLWGPDKGSTQHVASGSPEERSFTYEIVGNDLVLALAGNDDSDGTSFAFHKPGSDKWTVRVARKLSRMLIGPHNMTRRIDSLGVRNANLTTGLAANISAVGLDDQTMYSNDSLFSLYTTKETFYEPRFLAIESEEAPDPNTPGLVSNCYRLLPDAFVTARDFEVELRVDPEAIGVRPKQAGLCWWDEKQDKWVWINEYYEDDTTSGLIAGATLPEPRGYYPSGSSLGGGLFAVLIDTTAPTIADLSVKQGLTYKGLKPEIKFTLKDTLSGIKDDRFIDARINGRWLIPEFEPEMSRCRVYPYEPLKPGRCELMIVVEDQAGNIAEHRVDFFVKEQ